MANVRFKIFSVDEIAPTEEEVLAKLDSDISDAERHRYLKTLVDTQDTFYLICIVGYEWKKKLLLQQMDIELFKERMRVQHCYINAGGSKKDAQKLIEEISDKLQHAEAAYAKSNAYAGKSLEIMEKLLVPINEKLAKEEAEAKQSLKF